MMRFPYWFAEALIEQRKRGQVARRARDAVASPNSADRVLSEIGVLLALALALSAIVDGWLVYSGVR